MEPTRNQYEWLRTSLEAAEKQKAALVALKNEYENAKNEAPDGVLTSYWEEILRIDAKIAQRSPLEEHDTWTSCGFSPSSNETSRSTVRITGTRYLELTEGQSGAALAA